MELRLPKTTDIRAPWNLPAGGGFDLLDVVEVPEHSRRFYLVTFVDDAHYGFPNHYRTALLAQLADLSVSFFTGGGGSSTASTTTSGSTELSAGGGSSTATQVVPLLTPVESAGGGSSTAGSAAGSPADSAGGGSSTATAGVGEPAASAGGGAGAALVVIPIAYNPESAGGGSAIAAVTPGSTGGDSAGGGSSTATESSGGGTPSPGVDCNHAGTLTLPFHDTLVLLTSSDSWYKFSAAAGTTYHVKRVTNTGSLTACNIYTGTCGSLTQIGVAYPFDGSCFDWTTGGATTVYLEFNNPAGSESVLLDVGMGSC